MNPTAFQVNKTMGMVGSRTVLAAIKGGQDPRAVSCSSQPEIEDFRRVREKYLLY